MVHCCVPKCNNNARKSTLSAVNGQKVTFHRFPKVTRVRKEWIVNIRRDEGKHFKVNERTVVCSAHFTPECFRKSISDRRSLKVDAVPTLFSWTVPSRTRRVLQRKSATASQPECDSSDKTLSATESDIEHMARLIQAQKSVVYGPEVPSTAELLSALADRQREVDSLQQQLSISRFGLERYSADRDKLKFYTGFSSYALLTAFVDWITPAAQHMAYPYTQRVTRASVSSRRSLVLCDELFMTLCRLRAGLLEEDLSDRFNISVATVSRILIAWINLLYFTLGSINIWPSRECIDQYMPSVMKHSFPSVRVIIDCTEIFTQKPASLADNSRFFSSYKSHTTFKALVGIAPHGPITFISHLFSGSISDVELTKVSGLISLLEPGDSVMADKGFTIETLLSKHQVGLVIPHFLSARGQFSTNEIRQNDAITTSRVHVERAIRRIKEYRIFNGLTPLSMLGSINQIWTVCCLLSNFRPPLF